MEDNNTLKVIITGSTGLLGTHLLRTAPKQIKVFGAVHQYRTVLDLPQITYIDLDVTDPNQVNNTIKAISPDIVIHTAAHGRVDYCEQHPEEAKATNVLSTQYIVDALNRYGGKILFCSTNMIFDGLTPPYTEESKRNPQSVYGQTKVASEDYITGHANHFTIFRLMTMYGWNWQPERKNMISMAIEKLGKGQELWMTNDVFNNMLYVQEAAKAFWHAIEMGVDRELIQLAGKDCLNRFDSTQKVCEVFGFDPKLVHEVSSDYFKGQEVPRSPNTCFVTDKANKHIHFNSIFLKEGLTEMKSSPMVEKGKVV